MTEERRRGFKFDATLNLGNILALFIAIGSAAGAWAAMDSRVTSVETRQHTKIKEYDAKHQAHESSLREVMRDIDRKLERIDDKLDHIQKGK